MTGTDILLIKNKTENRIYTAAFITLNTKPLMHFWLFIFAVTTAFEKRILIGHKTPALMSRD